MGFFTWFGERRREDSVTVSYAYISPSTDPATFTGTRVPKEELVRAAKVPGRIEVLHDGPRPLTIEDLPLLYPGDQIFIRTEIKGKWSRWLVSWGIRVFTHTRKDKRPSVVNHDATVVGKIREFEAQVRSDFPDVPLSEDMRRSGPVVDYQIAEALGQGGFQYRSLLENYGDPELYSFAIARHKLVTDRHREKMVEVCEDLLGRSYGHLKIAAHALDYGLTKVWNMMGARSDVWAFRWLCRSKRYPMCSWASLYIYKKAGVPFSIPVEIGSPDDLWDECRRKFPEIWLWPFVSPRLYHELW